MKKLCIVTLLLFTICRIFAACGDVNSDGMVDILDALIIAQHYVDLNPVNFDPVAAEVNGDGFIDIVDALLVARYYVGLIPVLPGCSSVSPAPVTIFAVDCGDEVHGSYTAADGTVYEADKYFSGGFSFFTDTYDSISGTEDNTLYWSQRWGDSQYTIPVPYGHYIVTLHFAEIVENEAGVRIFDVLLEGTEIITGLDIFAAAGHDAAYVIVSEVFFINDGELNIQFVSNTGHATVGAIKVEAIPMSYDPLIDFSVNPQLIKPGGLVTVDASASFDPGGTIESYLVDFGDGHTADSAVASHVYRDEGTYTITVTVTDNDGNTATGTETIIVQENLKPRVIPATDGQLDDRTSMVRFLMYACDYEVAGILLVNSRYQYPYSFHERDWLDEMIDLYAQVLPNLRQHNPDYPDAGHLKDNIYPGNQNRNDLYTDPPDMEVQDTPGSQLIINTLLDNDPRPVHVPIWAGANTAAFALYRLKTSYSQADYERAVSKIRIYCIWYQDGGGQWIEDNIPGAKINHTYRWDNIWDPQSLTGPNPDEVKQYMTSDWLNDNVKQNHGPLGAHYYHQYINEAETPSFLHQVDNGLRSHEDYTLGGWGGRSAYNNPSTSNAMTDTGIEDDGDQNKMYWRWIIDAQNDFAARMDWCVASLYEDANHAPQAMVNGEYYYVPGGLGSVVSPGEVVTLDASPSTDPDGNNLSYFWWQYHDVDSALAKISINNNTSMDNASFAVPDEPGKQVHIILEVKDNGSPPLKGYVRLIFIIR